MAKIRRTYDGAGGITPGPHTAYQPPGAKVTGANIAILAGADPSTQLDFYYNVLLNQANYHTGGGSVTVVTYASIAADPVAGVASYDLLIIARGDANDAVLNSLKATAKPVLFMGGHRDTTRDFGMINGGQNGATASRVDIRIVAPHHPILAGLFAENELLVVRSSANQMTAFQPADQAGGIQVLAEDPDVAGAAVIAAIEQGGTWFNPANATTEEKTNTARKVMLGWGYADPDGVEQIAVAIFLRAVGWALNWF